jgi:hypothetical protein
MAKWAPEWRIPKTLVLFFRELVLFGVSETAHDQKSPTENVRGENACPDWRSGKVPDPKTGRPFLLTLLYPPI